MRSLNLLNRNRVLMLFLFALMALNLPGQDDSLSFINMSSKTSGVNTNDTCDDINEALKDGCTVKVRDKKTGEVLKSYQLKLTEEQKKVGATSLDPEKRKTENGKAETYYSLKLTPEDETESDFCQNCRELNEEFKLDEEVKRESFSRKMNNMDDVKSLANFLAKQDYEGAEEREEKAKEEEKEKKAIETLLAKYEKKKEKCLIEDYDASADTVAEFKASIKSFDKLGKLECKMALLEDAGLSGDESFLIMAGEMSKELPGLLFSKNREFGIELIDRLADASSSFGFAPHFTNDMNFLKYSSEQITSLATQSMSLPKNSPARTQVNQQLLGLMTQNSQMLGGTEWGNIISQKITLASENPRSYVRSLYSTGGAIDYTELIAGTDNYLLDEFFGEREANIMQLIDLGQNAPGARNGSRVYIPGGIPSSQFRNSTSITTRPSVFNQNQGVQTYGTGRASGRNNTGYQRPPQPYSSNNQNYYNSNATYNGPGAGYYSQAGTPYNANYNTNSYSPSTNFSTGFNASGSGSGFYGSGNGAYTQPRTGY